MSTDTDRIVNFCQSFHQFWSLPFQIGVSLYLLEQQVRLYTPCKVVTDHNYAGSDLKLPCFSFSHTFVWKAGEDPGNTGWHQAWRGQFLKMHVRVLIVSAQLMCCWLMLSYYLVCCDSIASFPGSPRAQTKNPASAPAFPYWIEVMESWAGPENEASDSSWFMNPRKNLSLIPRS